MGLLEDSTPLLSAPKMDKSVIFLFFLLNVIYVWSSPRMIHFVNKREIFCGTRLTDALEMVCKGKYNSPSKKSLSDFVSYNEYDELFPSETDEDNQVDFPFLEKQTANSFLPMRYRKGRVGIVDECCRKPCTLKHLSLYCA